MNADGAKNSDAAHVGLERHERALASPTGEPSAHDKRYGSSTGERIWVDAAGLHTTSSPPIPEPESTHPVLRAICGRAIQGAKPR